MQVTAWEGPVIQDAPAQGRARIGLRQWPVQLHLLPPAAPFLQGATLTLIADCVPFANPNMHADLMVDTAIAVGCPKLDDSRAYIQKLTEILQRSDVRSLRAAYMEVPCCRGLVFVAQQALQASGRTIPFETCSSTSTADFCLHKEVACQTPRLKRGPAGRGAP